MKGFASRTLCMFLALVLAGAAEPARLLAQQTPAELQQPTPSQDQPADPQAPTADQQATPAQSADQSQQPPAATQEQAPNPNREEQENKASQELINGNRENGTQLPESPDATRAREAAAQAQQSAPQTVPGEPTGTAAAPAGKVVGSVASRPAGAAIAPAKQRQVRSFLIKLGVLAGAGIALGTVYALSKASSPTPPGAR